MSAFIVDKEDIDALVIGLIRNGIVTDVAPDDLGKYLWDENVRSIHYRYPDTAENDSDYPGPIGFSMSWVSQYKFAPRDVSDAELRKIANCYDYQTCEHPTYLGSQVDLWISQLVSEVPGSQIAKLWREAESTQ